MVAIVKAAGDRMILPVTFFYIKVRPGVKSPNDGGLVGLVAMHRQDGFGLDRSVAGPCSLDLTGPIGTKKKGPVGPILY